MPLWHFTHTAAPFSEHQLGSQWWCSHSQGQVLSILLWGQCSSPALLASLWPQSGLLPGVSCGIGAVLWVPGRAPHACMSPTGWGGCLFPCEVHVSLQFHLVLRGGCEGQHRALRPAACPRHPAEKQASSPGETHSLNAPFWDRWAHPQAGGSCSSFWTVETGMGIPARLGKQNASRRGACFRVKGTYARQDWTRTRRVGSDQLLETAPLEAAMAWAPEQVRTMPCCLLPTPFCFCPDWFPIKESFSLLSLMPHAPHKTHLLPWVFPSLSSSQPLCPEQDPQTKDHGHLQIILCDGGHAVHARVLSNIPGLHPLDTSGNPPTCSMTT